MKVLGYSNWLGVSVYVCKSDRLVYLQFFASLSAIWSKPTNGSP